MHARNDFPLINLDCSFFKSDLVLNTTNNKCCVFIHGWNGDENSMDILYSHLPANISFISPRAFHPTSEGGFSWAVSIQIWSTIQEKKRSPLNELLYSVHRMDQMIDFWFSLLKRKPDEVYITGFSQGGAVALLLGLTFPKKYTRIACFSGFLPDDYQLNSINNSLSQNKFLLFHGTRDNIIPVEEIYHIHYRLQKNNLDVILQVKDYGHKLNVSFRNQLLDFFS